MEKIKLAKDIPVFYYQASSFPDGILDAQQKIQEIIPDKKDRQIFGISRPEEEADGEIVYKAAAEELSPGEGERLNCPVLSVKSGDYISILVPDYLNHLSKVTEAFQQLLDYPNLDPQGYCVEWYKGNDVRCMIRLEE